MNAIEAMEDVKNFLDAEAYALRLGKSASSHERFRVYADNLRAAIEREKEREKVFEQMRFYATRLCRALRDLGDCESMQCENDYDADCNCPICRSLDARRSLEQLLFAAERIEKGNIK